MLRYFRFVIIFMLISFSAAAQEITFNASIGGGTYAMKDFKTWQTGITEQLAFKATITDKFPPYLFYEGSCNVIWENSFFAGFSFAYGSTGGRVQYRDYSGYLRADQKLRYMNFGMPIGFHLNILENLTLGFDLKPTYTRTFADMTFEQEVLGSHSIQKVSFKSESLAVQPGVFITRKIGRFGIHAQASYYLTVKKGKLYYKDDDQFYLLNNGKPVYATWDGARLSIGASFFISE
jgi:hypothetical protein